MAQVDKKNWVSNPGPLRPDTLGGEDFSSFHYIFTNQHGLMEAKRGSPKKHFYKIIQKSARHLQERRFFLKI